MLVQSSPRLDQKTKLRVTAIISLERKQEEVSLQNLGRATKHDKEGWVSMLMTRIIMLRCHSEHVSHEHSKNILRYPCSGIHRT